MPWLALLEGSGGIRTHGTGQCSHHYCPTPSCEKVL